jgi:hypothetical protein
MLFLQSPPDTLRYMYAGYGIAILVMVLYAVSLFMRESRLKREFQDLQELTEKQ